MQENWVAVMARIYDESLEKFEMERMDSVKVILE